MVMVMVMSIYPLMTFNSETICQNYLEMLSVRDRVTQIHSVLA